MILRYPVAAVRTSSNVISLDAEAFAHRVVAEGSEAVNQLMSASLSLCEMSLACKLSTISSMSPSMKRSRL